MAKALSTEERGKQFNRQVNYFIMRYMWQVVCGKSKRETEDTIYNAFDTSRERYTRVINAGIIRYKDKELEMLTQRTGLSEGIFTGEERFQCPHIVDKTRYGDIALEEWHKLLDWRRPSETKEEDKVTEAGNEVKTKPEGLKELQDGIYKKLRSVERKSRKNREFYRLCYYLRERQPAPIKTSVEILQDGVTAIRSWDFNLLDDISIKNLETLQDVLSQKLTLVTTVLSYKKVKAEAQDTKKQV